LLVLVLHTHHARASDVFCNTIHIHTRLSSRLSRMLLQKENKLAITIILAARSTYVGSATTTNNS